MVEFDGEGQWRKRGEEEERRDTTEGILHDA